MGEVTFVKGGEAFDMATNGNPIKEKHSKLVLRCMYASTHEYEYVKVRTPDSDIFWILLYHARKISSPILFDKGFGNKKHSTLQSCQITTQHKCAMLC